MKELSARQLYFYFLCIAPVGKLILMPAQLVSGAKNDLLFPALLHMLLSAGAVFCVMLAARAEKPLPELLSAAFGRIGAAAILFLFAAFFLFAAVFPLTEQMLLVQSVYYDTLPSILSFLPFFLFSAYFCARPFAENGRIFDLLAPLSALGFLGLMVLAVPSADFSALLPAGAAGGNGFLLAARESALWFFDPALLLLFAGRFRYRSGMAWKTAAFSLLGSAAVLFFLAVFYGIFSDLALRQTFAFAKVSKYFSAITVLGRIDYLFLCLLTLVMAFYAALPLQACCACLHGGTNGKLPRPAAACAVNAAALALLLLTRFRYAALQEWLMHKLFWIFPLFGVLLPALTLLLRRSRRAR